MSRIRKVLLTILFLAGLAAVLYVVSLPFVSDKRSYQIMRSFYQERKHPLDAVYIGASNEYSYFQTPLCFGDYGYTVHSVSFPGAPVEATSYLIEECRKTQPDALYIINLNNLKHAGEISEADIHETVNFLPLSRTKLRLIGKLCDKAEIPGKDRLEYLLPIIRFHSNWSGLDSEKYLLSLNGLKAGSEYNSFLTRTSDQTGKIAVTDSRVRLDPNQEEALLDILDYCDREHVNALFIFVPQVFSNESTLAQYNTAGDIAAERGYPVLNLQSAADEMDIDTTRDYYNSMHVNVHGSVKYTDYLGRYLSEHYDFSDKREDPDYADWSQAAKDYVELLKPYTTDFERKHLKRDLSLKAPALSSCEPLSDGARLKWKASAGAEGYLIYRRYNYPELGDLTPWVKAGEVGAGVLEFEDLGLKPDIRYNYTVVPIRKEGKTKVYGCFDYLSIGVTTRMKDPELLSLEDRGDSVTIRWAPMDHVDGYYVYRKVVGQYWANIATVTDETEYTDYYFEADYPCYYSVAGFRVDEEDEELLLVGSHSEEGLLRYKDIQAPEVSISVDKDGNPVLSWNAVRGASGYSVCRVLPDGSTEAAAPDLDNKKFSWTDKNAGEETRLVYRVSSVIQYGDARYEFFSDDIVIESGKEDADS